MPPARRSPALAATSLLALALAACVAAPVPAVGGGPPPRTSPAPSATPGIPAAALDGQWTLFEAADPPADAETACYDQAWTFERTGDALTVTHHFGLLIGSGPNPGNGGPIAVPSPAPRDSWPPSTGKVEGRTVRVTAAPAMAAPVTYELVYDPASRRLAGTSGGRKVVLVRAPQAGPCSVPRP